MSNGGLDRVRVIFSWVALAVWVVSLIVDAAIPSYEAPYSVHLVLMAVVGALFGPKITGRGNGDPGRHAP